MRGDGTARPAGAADRTTFLEFQARNRRATWKLTAACALVVGGGGLLSAFAFIGGVGLVLFAMTFIPAVVLFGVGFLAMLTPVTGLLSEPLFWIAGKLLDSVAGGVLPWFGSHALLLALGLPVGAWLAVRAVWLTAGVGETLLAMGARPPDPADPEERQLVNLVQEMAIAAGIPAPRVRLIDGPVANAAAAGWDQAESYVVVGRRVLDELDREATQGLLAHVVGSIGNGDLQGAAQVHSLLYVLELMIVVVLAPFARFPRRIAWAWLAFPLAGGRGEARAARARELIALLARHRALMQATGDDIALGLGRDYFGPMGRLLLRACPPFLALIFLVKAATGFLLLFAGVPVALLWRSRRYLADATAVQLTRHPTGLYRALARLVECGALIPGGEPLAHLFVVGPEVAVARARRQRERDMLRWMHRLQARGQAARAEDRASPATWLDAAKQAASAGAELAASQQAAQAREEAAQRNTFSEREGLLMGMHPPLARRLKRLVRMGAVPDAAPTP
jgi:Zn-dependent protease with chaperone function